MFRKFLILLTAVLLCACNEKLMHILPKPPTGVSAVDGNATRGENIFRHGVNEAPPCLSCHSLGDSLFSLGPQMIGISERAGQRVPGLTAEAYMRQSIRDPHAYVVAGYRDIMYPQYAEKLTDQDIADLIAFLQTL